MTDRDTGEVRSLPRYTSAGIEDHSEWHVNARDHDEVVAGKDETIRILRSAFDAVQASEDIADEHVEELEADLIRVRATVARLESERDERQEERDKLRMVLGLMAGGVGRSLPEEAEHQLDTLRARVSELDDHYRMAAAAAKSSGDEVERLTYALRFRRKLHREAKVRAALTPPSQSG